MSDLDFCILRAPGEPEAAEEMLHWACRTFAPRIVASSSFQTQSVPLLHMISRVCPEMPVIFLDTGFHFPETLAFRDELVERFRLKLVVVRPELSREEFLRSYGEDVYRRDPDLCCYVNKVEPMQRALDGMVAWVAGVRRDQTENRHSLRGLEPQISGVIKVHPLLHWTHAHVEAYCGRYALPAHPLEAQGYPSVGCDPCTEPVTGSVDERAGRWAGMAKEECGLHLDPTPSSRARE